MKMEATASVTTLGYCGVMSVFYYSPGGRQAFLLVIVLIITKVKPLCAIKSLLHPKGSTLS